MVPTAVPLLRAPGRHLACIHLFLCLSSLPRQERERGRKGGIGGAKEWREKREGTRWDRVAGRGKRVKEQILDSCPHLSCLCLLSPSHLQNRQDPCFSPGWSTYFQHECWHGWTPLWKTVIPTLPKREACVCMGKWVNGCLAAGSHRRATPRKRMCTQVLKWVRGERLTGAVFRGQRKEKNQTKQRKAGRWDDWKI